MKQHYPTIVLIGSAGAGKGTQADLIEEQLGYHKVESGKIWRAVKKTDTPQGQKIREWDKVGGHADDQFITDLMDDYIIGVSKSEPLLIDGYPRSIGQAEMLLGLLEKSGRNKDNVIALWLNIPREEAERRLLNRSECRTCKTLYPSRDITTCPHCGGEVAPREYDNPNAIKNRLDHFEKVVMPVIEWYKEKDSLIEINGLGEIVHVFDEVKQKLQPYLEQQS